MRNINPKISAFILTILFGLVLCTNSAHAQTSDIAKLFGFDLANAVTQLFANVFNVLQIITSWLLILTGSILNYSINLTLQMKVFLEQTPAVYTTWKALRDISGLFIIFFLLYAAIRLILGLGTKFGDLIKNIVIAGVLINFSFFFAGLGIDASNIVSTQLYNAIAPANSLNAGNLVPEGITNKWADGGLSDIFMKSLKIPALYDTNAQITPAGETAQAGGAWTGPIKILLIGVASIIIMLTAALSFAAAALAFVIRFVVLIFLLAFSPIWFASHIIPEIGGYAKKWTDLYKGMLVFMPVYLLLMYLALNVMTTTPFLSGGDTANVAAALAGGSAGAWYSSIIALSINAVIVIVLLNFPLVAAISIGGGAVKFINTDKLGSWGVLGGARRTGGVAYQNVVARGASRIARSEGFQNIAAKSWFGEQALKGTRSVATDYNKKLDEKIKSREDFAKSLDRNKRAKNDYVQRLTTSIPATLSMFGTVGRADRVGAAKILRNRIKEIRDDINKLNSEENGLNNIQTKAATGGRQLTLTEQRRLTTEIPRDMNDFQTAMTDAENQLTAFQTDVGTSAKDVEKRTY